MGCPNWPKCFDKWYPPLDKSELPDDCKKYYKETAFIRANIDQEYFKVFKEASEKNVKMFCYDCKFSSKGIEINNEIKILFNDR